MIAKVNEIDHEANVPDNQNGKQNWPEHVPGNASEVVGLTSDVPMSCPNYDASKRGEE
jgi:hypothetical protein